jgi:hypothetical protein
VIKEYKMYPYKKKKVPKYYKLLYYNTKSL